MLGILGLAWRSVRLAAARSGGATAPRRRVLAGGLLAVLAIVVASGRASAQESAKPAEPLRVVVTIPPLKGIIEPLLPKGSDVRLLMAPGRSEHGYEFTPSDLAAVAKADVVFYVGLGLELAVEKQLRDRPNQKRQEVGFAAAVGIQPAADHAHDHEHEGHGEHCVHHGGGIDQHLWLDPILVEQVVPALRQAIQKAQATRGMLDDVERKRLSDAEAKLVADVKALHQEYESRLAPVKGKSFVTHHNAFGRVAQRYGIVVADSIREFDNSEPSPKEINAVVAAIRQRNVKVIFVEPQYSRAAAERIATIAKVALGQLDPLGDGDYFKMMRANLEQFATHLAK